MKICNKCGIEKDLNEFQKCTASIDGYHRNCKNCKNIWLRNYRSTDEYKNRASERNKLNCKKYNLENKEKLNEARKLYYIENPEAAERDRQRKTKYSKSAKGKANRRRYTVERRKYDSLQRLKECLMSRVTSMLKKKSWMKTSKTQEILGCTYLEARNYIEKQFSMGMNWENHGRGDGKWHIDHRIPLDSAKNKEEMERLCHYTNLQPLWGSDNIRKSNKIMCTPTVYQGLK